MIIADEFKTLILSVASYDSVAGTYSETLDAENYKKLEEKFKLLINNILISNGTEPEKIAPNYRKLAREFHPDKKDRYSLEVSWLEKQLSAGKYDGTCFRIVTFYNELLSNPQKIQPITYHDIKTRDDFKKWLEKLRVESATVIQKNFYASLLGLLEQSGDYFDKTDKINTKGLRALIRILPIVFSGYGAVVFSQQLFAMYALYFIMLKGGNRLKESHFKELTVIGNSLQGMSVATATLTTTILVRLLEMTFWVSRHGLNMSLQAGAAVFKPFLTWNKNKKPSSSEPMELLSYELEQASKNMTTGREFKCVTLKLIAAPFEQYLISNEKQFLNNWRAGLIKNARFQSLLHTMLSIDQTEGNDEQKIQKTKELLEQLKIETNINTKGSKAAAAIQTAEMVFEFVQEVEPEPLLIAYHN